MENPQRVSGSTDGSVEDFTSTNSLITFSHSSSRRTKKWLMALVGSLAAATIIIGLSSGLTLNKNTAQNGCQKPDCDDTDNFILGPSNFDQKSDIHNDSQQSSDINKGASGVFPRAAVTSDSKVCSDIGREVLMRNGSAVDAIIAAELCAGLFVPHSMGVGGGFFMTIYDRTAKKTVVIDARETAPEAATVDMYHGNGSLSEDGPLAIAIPGEFRGLELAHQLYGRTPWAELLRPSIDLCHKGIEVQSALAKALQEKRTDIMADPGLRQVFVDPKTGDLYKVGDFYTNPQLGKTLEIISKEGAGAFYDGQLAKDLVEELQGLGAIVTLDDMANYTALVKDPTITKLSNGITVYGVPPPGSGAIVSNILMTLDGYHFDPSDLESDDVSTLMHHRIVEAFKFAYAKRTAMGDPAFVDMTGFVENMTSPDYAAAIRGQINDNRTYPAEYYQPVFGIQEDHGTSHLSVVAPDGAAASLTSTINLYFGAKILSRTTGIILNDEMDDFSSPNITNYFGVPPSQSNFIVPGKRPVSSMTPTIVINENNDVILVDGAAGGTRITTATAYTLIRNIWLSENVTQATRERRVHHQLYPQQVEYEFGFSEAILHGLQQKGHLVVQKNSSGVVNLIARTTNGSFEAYADERKGGGVSGF